MIVFSCGGCGRQFTVPPTFAGRRATCKTCGAHVVVPAVVETAFEPAESLPAEPAPAVAAAPRLPVRTRRLMADAEQMREAFDHSGHIRVLSTTGNPPEIYQIEYTVRGLQRGEGDDPAFRETHVVEIQLTSEYPRFSPKCKMLTPIFHPNIDPATICVGDHWTAGERLVDLTVRIGEMIAYQAYNIKSPLDAEAAMWADLHPEQLPVDSRSLRPAEAS